MSKLRGKFYYGWRIIGATFILGALINGLFFSFGLFQKPLIDEFSWLRADVSLSATVAIVVLSISSLVSGILVDKFGPRIVCSIGALVMGGGMMLASLIYEVWQLYLVFALIGLGGGTLETPPIGIVTKFFIRRRGLALGIATAGIGVGVLALSPIIQNFITAFGWRDAFLLTGIIPVILGIPTASIFMRSTPEDLGLLPNGGKYNNNAEQFSTTLVQEYSLRAAVRLPQFWLLFCIYICMVAGLFGVTYHLPAYATDSGISSIWAAATVGLVGGFSIIGRIVTGIVSDKIGRKITLIFIYSILAVALIILIWVKTTFLLIPWVFIFGFCYGAMFVAVWGLVADLFGRKAVSSILGAIAIGAGIGGFLGPWLAGHIFDASQSYEQAFISFAGLFLVAIILSLLIRPITKGKYL